MSAQKIMERHRRGKLHAAKCGSVNVLGGAPYGYRYIDKMTGGGQAYLVIKEDEAHIIKQIFNWVGRDKLSIGEVCRRLKEANIPSSKGKSYWDRSVIWAMLKNPAYKGSAAFGKTQTGKKLPSIRPQKHSTQYPKQSYSIYKVPKEKWITIQVPAIIDEVLFDTVEQQLEQNRKRARTRKRGARHLLQGLLVCNCCRYAYYGKPVCNKRGEKVDRYVYYRCIGTDAYRFGGKRICQNKPVRSDMLETVVWEEVKQLLSHPDYLMREYARRANSLSSVSKEDKIALDSQVKRLQKGMNRLIDSYTEGYFNKSEFEPRTSHMRQKLVSIRQQQEKIIDAEQLKHDLQVGINSINEFSSAIEYNCKHISWENKRTIIRALVKQIEIDMDNINIVFRLNPPTENSNNNDGLAKKQNNKNLQHCWWGKWPCLGSYEPLLGVLVPLT